MIQSFRSVEVNDENRKEILSIIANQSESLEMDRDIIRQKDMVVVSIPMVNLKVRERVAFSFERKGSIPEDFKESIDIAVKRLSE